MKLGIRFLKRFGKPPAMLKTNFSPGRFKSLVESAGFKVEVQFIGDKVKVLYLKGRKNENSA